MPVSFLLFALLGLGALGLLALFVLACERV